LLNGKNSLIWLLVQKSQNMGHLTQEQRYKIEVLIQEDYSGSEIAKILGKHKSVVYNELNRNSDVRSGQYKAELAQKKCSQRHRLKPKKIHFTEEVKEHVNFWIKEDYSPEQIVGVARLEGINCVSHERIYQQVFQNLKEKESQL